MLRQIGNHQGVVLKGGHQQNGGSSASDLPSGLDSFQDVAAMRTALAAANGARYTTARLGNMTYNDLVFAMRREGVVSGTLDDF